MSAQNLEFFQDLNPRYAAALRAALQLFAKNGYFQTSIHDIASEAEVSIGFLYHHFSNKQGLARALYHQLLSHVNERLDRIEQKHERAEARCRAVIAMLFEITEQDPELMAFIVYARHQEFLPQETPVCSSTAFARMRSFVYQGIENGEIRAMDPLVAAIIAYGGALRMVCLWLDGFIEESVSSYLDALWENTWESLKPA